ncbi:translation initiation factor IF-3 [Hydrogenovibrio sp. 3SP14C1]|uniref:translation initiation factor IF-3 n=1 Tax=Hydrogenovibrio sp. 3SP14C1 TaxID=3038774 RepID=UPI002415F94E|nr:translation initiation factor IF-3 [Hydrogenovibrio sp. 3SP14C1]MDG4812224.1 translation initiation factor IF-3 [Hydrogenovibrio sp. 3SP14C1]
MAVRRGRGRPQQPEAPKDNINGNISAKEVRLIDADGEQRGVVSIEEALDVAKEAELDLVEISAKSSPPVCRIMDYGKYVYQQQKKKHEAKKKQKQVQVKEVKFRPGTEQGDYDVKMRNLMKFLENGDRVKVTIWFRGREITHKELGMKMLERVRDDIQEVATVEQMPKMEGRQLQMMVAPIKKQ